MMPEQRLPLSIDPLRYAKTRRQLAGSVALADLPRLADVLAKKEGVVVVEMAFFFDEEKRVIVKLQVKTQLSLICQRCLQPLEYPVDAISELCVVNDEKEVETIPEQYEPLVVKGEQFVPLDVIEEELLLSVPLVAVHHNKDCAGSQDGAYYPVPSADSKERHRPFEVLAQLKK